MGRLDPGFIPCKNNMPTKINVNSAFNQTFKIPVVFIDGEKKLLVLSGELYTQNQALAKFKDIIDMEYTAEEIKRHYVRYCIMGNSKAKSYRKRPTWWLCKNGRCAKKVWVLNYTKVEANRRSKSILHRWFGL